MRARLEGPSLVDVIGIVKGLKSSGDLVDSMLRREKYDVIMLAITEDEVAGLRDFVKHPYEVEMDDIELIYEYLIRRFGETSIPPEAFVRAIKLGDSIGSSVIGIDIPSGKYEELFVANIPLTDLIWLSLQKKRLIRRKWDFTDPEQFSIQWDKIVNRKGYRKMEEERESYMAKEISEKKGASTLAIIEVERFSGVVFHLENLLQGYKLQMS